MNGCPKQSKTSLPAETTGLAAYFLITVINSHGIWIIVITLYPIFFDTTDER